MMMSVCLFNGVFHPFREICSSFLHFAFKMIKSIIYLFLIPFIPSIDRVRNNRSRMTDERHGSLGNAFHRFGEARLELLVGRVHDPLCRHGRLWNH